MDPFTDDIWEIILARLPITSITTSKLVCKQWKSIVESPFFHELFMSYHQNLHSSWSLIHRHKKGLKEVMAQYGCEIWRLPRSLGSYISSFLTDKFQTEEEKVRIMAYTDVGLVLISLGSELENQTYYVANPISRQCVKIPPRPLRPLEHKERFYRPGLVTRIEKDILLGYKVVLVETSNISMGVLSLLVYSSETGLWSFKTLKSHPRLHSMPFIDPITLNGNIYWISNYVDHNSQYVEDLVSHDLYATGTESEHCRLISFPDFEIKHRIFQRRCTTSQDSLMYMNIVCENKVYKLRVWRLKSTEWQLIYDIYPVTNFDYLPLAIDPFDGDTLYMWSRHYGRFASTNLYKRQFGLHNNLECSSDGCTLCFATEWDDSDKHIIYDPIIHPYLPRFVLPRWLHPIPSSPS